MGGGGGGSYIPPSSDSIQRKIEEARQAERARLDEDVNGLLQRFLIEINDRDVERTQRQIEDIAELLAGTADIEALLFGGSVAKHTYVDGLSDVDALVILDRSGTQGLSPQRLLDDFCQTLSDHLSRREVATVDRGALAVTVRFRDGGELQLLPAVRLRETICIPDHSGKGWRETNPRAFQRELSHQNDRLGRALVPTIKLIKSLVGDLPKQQQLSGYHLEALSLEAIRGYRGPQTPRALLIHILAHGSERVLRPIRDITGQSHTVDEYLGRANSAERKLMSQALAGIRRRLESATSVAQWRAMFGVTEP